MQSMKFSLCFNALEKTRAYIATNSKPPVVSNRPRISNPIMVTMSAVLFNESSFNPFLSSITEIPSGPASSNTSNKIIELYKTPVSHLASFRPTATGNDTAIRVSVAIILPEEEASFSRSTSEMIIPIGTIINKVQIMFWAKSVIPTDVKAIVNRTIGPIKLILPSGPQEYSIGSCSVLASGNTQALVFES